MAGSASLYHDKTPTDPFPFVSATDAAHGSNGFNAVKQDLESWSGMLPAKQGLYLNENKKDACGISFVCHIKDQQMSLVSLT
jgi:glutamate synthase (NADH)